MKQLVAIVAYYMFGYLIFWTFLHETDLFPKVWVQDNFSIAIYLVLNGVNALEIKVHGG